MSSSRKARFAPGFTITEIIVASIVLVIGILGSASFRYQARLDVKRASLRASASRVALFLCESWKGLSGSEFYNPVSLFGTDLSIESSSGPDKPEDFTLLGSYKIALNDINYYATLSFRDLDPEIRALNATIAWEQRGNEQASMDDADKLYGITTYTER